MNFIYNLPGVIQLTDLIDFEMWNSCYADIYQDHKVAIKICLVSSMHEVTLLI